MRRRHKHRSSGCSIPLLLALLAACFGCALLLGTHLEATGLVQPLLAVRKARRLPRAAAAASQLLMQSIEAPRPLGVQVLEQALPADRLGMFAAPEREHADPTEKWHAGPSPDHEAPQQGDPGSSSASGASEPAADEAAARQELAALERHVAQQGTAREFFGKGCRWREAARAPAAAGGQGCTLRNRRGAMFGGIESVWRCHAYEYWHPERQRWSAEQPAACRVQSMPLADWALQRGPLLHGKASRQSTGVKASTWSLQALAQQQQEQEQQTQAQTGAPRRPGVAVVAAGPGTAGMPARAPAAQRVPTSRRSRDDVATDSACAAHYCVLRNVWYNNGRFYYLADKRTPPLPGSGWQLGRNRANSVLHVRSAPVFAAGVDARVVLGETAVSGGAGTRVRRGAKPAHLPCPCTHALASVPMCANFRSAPLPVLQRLHSCNPFGRCWTTTSSCTLGP